MSEESEYLLVRCDLPLHLVFDLHSHDLELTMHFIWTQVPPDSFELVARLLNLPISNQVTRRVRHEGDQPEEHNDTPRNLNSKWKSPLDWPIRCKAAGVSNPIGSHSTKGNPASRDTTNETAIPGVRNLTQVNGHSCHQSPIQHLSLQSKSLKV
ncbi:unnamed protein product [Aspergillus oryzae]|nr:unnamed protein product [Aspergillus oryzae]GMF87426.1 unnamed protein product [Aspergillus oryzae]